MKFWVSEIQVCLLLSNLFSYIWGECEFWIKMRFSSTFIILAFSTLRYPTFPKIEWLSNAVVPSWTVAIRCYIIKVKDIIWPFTGKVGASTRQSYLRKWSLGFRSVWRSFQGSLDRPTWRTRECGNGNNGGSKNFESGKYGARVFPKRSENYDSTKAPELGSHLRSMRSIRATLYCNRVLPQWKSFGLSEGRRWTNLWNARTCEIDRLVELMPSCLHCNSNFVIPRLTTTGLT